MGKFVDFLKKMGEYLDNSPTFVNVSGEEPFVQKIKELLEKYALYNATVTCLDGTLNGFGTWTCEFLGTEENVNTFTFVSQQLLYDRLKLYYDTRFTRVEAFFEKTGDNFYLVKYFYSFNQRTFNNFSAYKNSLIVEKKREILFGNKLQDDDLEREMRQWGE